MKVRQNRDGTWPKRPEGELRVEWIPRHAPDDRTEKERTMSNTSNVPAVGERAHYRNKRGWLTKAALANGMREVRAWLTGDGVHVLLTLSLYSRGYRVNLVDDTGSRSSTYYTTLTEARREFTRRWTP